MSKSDTQASGGLMSSAGLSTYYDSEDQNIQISPATVTMLTILIGIIFITINIVF